MQNPQQQIMMQVAQALQQGADPKQILGELVKMGMQQDQAMSVIQTVMSQLQGGQQGAGPQMAKGGYTGTWSGNQGFAHGGISPYMYNDPYSTIMAMGGNIPGLRKAQNGLQTTSADSMGVPQEQDYPDHGSYMRAMNDYFNNLYMPQNTMANEEEMMPANTQQVGYQNPALAAISTPAAVVSSQGVAPSTAASTSQVYGTPHPEYSIVDLLNSLGAKSDRKTRNQIAKELGIQGYKGYDYQNLEMIRRISKYADEIRKNPEDYDIAKLIASTPTSSTTSWRQSEIDEMNKGLIADAMRWQKPTPNIIDSMGNQRNAPPFLGADSTRKAKEIDEKNKKKSTPFPWASAIALGTGIPLGGYAAFKTAADFVDLSDKITSGTPKALDKALAVTRNKLLETASKDIKGAYDKFKKLPVRQQKSLIMDENVKMMLDEARAEQALSSAYETKEALKIAAEEAAIPTTKAGKAALKTAAEIAKANRLARIANRTGEGVKGVGEFFKALKNARFEMGGAYIPEYGQMAYGGYHSEIPRLFNQPVDRPNKAMYGMGMAKGGQMPQWLAERRFTAAGNRDKMADYGYQQGGVVEIDPADYEQTIQRLRDGGYQFEILD